MLIAGKEFEPKALTRRQIRILKTDHSLDIFDLADKLDGDNGSKAAGEMMETVLQVAYPSKEQQNDLDDGPWSDSMNLFTQIMENSFKGIEEKN